MFKAIHKESGQVVAIKQVPVESDLQEIIKEISIMQQCDRFKEGTAFLSLYFTTSIRSKHPLCPLSVMFAFVVDFSLG